MVEPVVAAQPQVAEPRRAGPEDRRRQVLPLLPFDGGHIAVWWYERIRSKVYARRRRPDPGRVDYYRLMPVTYAVILVAGAFTLLTVLADIINPVRMFS